MKRVRQAMAAMTLVLLTAAWGCGEGIPQDETDAPNAAAPEAAPAAVTGADLTIVLEGLITVEEGTHDGKPALWVLMADTRKAGPDHLPPCVPKEAAGHYPPHSPVIFVQGAEIWEDGAKRADQLVAIEDYDITVETSRTGFPNGMDLDRLVTSDELRDGWGDGAAAIAIDPAFYTSSVTADDTDILVGRIRIDGGDSVVARANYCEVEQGIPAANQRQFRFTDDPLENECHEDDATKRVRLGEDVVITQRDAGEVTLTLSNDKVDRVLTLKPTGDFGIAFRNVMPAYETVPVDYCEPGPAMAHYGSYRWMYGFEKLGSPADRTRCLVAPCQANPDVSGGGYKCPIP